MIKTKPSYYVVHWLDAVVDNSVNLKDVLNKKSSLVTQITVGEIVKKDIGEIIIVTTRCGDDADVIVVPTRQIVKITQLNEGKNIELYNVKVAE